MTAPNRRRSTLRRPSFRGSDGNPGSGGRGRTAWPLALTIALPPTAIVLVFTGVAIWLVRDTDGGAVASLLAAALWALVAVVGVGVVTYRLIGGGLARITEVTEQIADRPASEEVYALQLPTSRNDEIGHLARAIERASTEVRNVLDDAADQNEMLFMAKQTLEQRLTERLRESSELRGALDREVHARLRADARARKYETLIQYSGDAILVADASGRIEFTNQAFERLTGYSPAEVAGQELSVLKFDTGGRRILDDALTAIREGGVFRGVLSAEGKGGRNFFAETTISPVGTAADGARGLVAILRDATERVRRDTEIHYLAKYDPLTRLPNRVSLLEHLQAITRSTRRSRDRNVRAAVLYMDLDGFKPINDTYGHHVGDRVLAEIAVRLRALLRADDVIARVGGDEFIAVLADIIDIDTARRVAQKLIEGLTAPIVVGGEPLRVSAAIGLAIFPDHAIDAFQLIKYADAAMYRAKEKGGGCVEVYEPVAIGLVAPAEERLRMRILPRREAVTDASVLTDLSLSAGSVEASPLVASPLSTRLGRGAARRGNPPGDPSGQ